MLRRKVRGYDSFQCIAGDCPETCCAGWLIEIDDKALEDYKKETSLYGDTLRAKIDWEEKVFRQDADARCAFLRQDGLCDMYCHLGEDSLCLTCTSYPRHTEEFENVREYSLAISCPAVAEELLATGQPLSWETWEDDETEEPYEEFHGLLYEKLVRMRQCMIAIMQERRIPFAIRCHTMLQKVNAMQEALDEGRWVECLLDAEAAGDAREGIGAFASLEDMHVLFCNLYALEPLSYAWRERLQAAEHLLYETDQKTYTDLRQEFEDSQPDLFIKMEQIVVYFIFAYFCGAVYDEYVYALAQEAVVNAYLIRELWLAKWLEQDKTITLKDMAEIAYRYSRELEHSEENLECMEELMDGEILV